MHILALALTLLSGTTEPHDCETAGVRLQILGSGGPEINDGRTSSGYLIWVKDRARLMIDAGPGSATAFDKAGARFEDLYAIALTHLHVDHSADLPAYVKGSYFSSRTARLPIIGPAGNALMPSTSTYVRALFGAEGAYRYLGDYIDGSAAWTLAPVDRELVRGQSKSTALEDNIILTSVPVHHGPVAALVWRVDISDCRIAFTGDTSLRWPEVTDLVADSDILVAHVAVPDDASGTAIQLHAKPSQIGKLAHSARVGILVLSHWMNRTLADPDAVVASVREHFNGQIIQANDGMIIGSAVNSP